MPTILLRFSLSPLVILLIAAFSSQWAAAQTTAAAPWVVQERWAFKDGAPETPAALAQTADGYLWVGAPAGLFRFDGTRFELFRAASGEPLQSTFVSALSAADDGLWVGYWFGGFSSLKNGRVRNFANTTGTVTGFARDKSGTVWAGGQSRSDASGLWRFDGSSWQNIAEQWSFPAQPVAHLGFDLDGNLWVLTGRRSAEAAKELHVLPAGERAFRKAGEQLFVRGFTWDADHNVVTNSDAGVPAGGSFSAWDGPPLARPILRRRSFQVLDRADGAWVFSFDSGVLRHPRGDPLPTIIAQAGPDNSQTYDVDPSEGATLIDREGSLWMGSAIGMQRLSYSPLVRQELPPSDLSSFMVAPEEGGEVWISASDGRGKSVIYRVRDGKVESERSVPGVSSFAYRAPDGTHWFAGEGGLWHLANDRFSRVDLPPEWAALARFMVTMTHDGSGGYWIFISGVGLYRLKDGNWTKYLPAPQLPRAEAVKRCPGSGPLIAFTDHADRIWLGCTKGQVAIIDGEKETSFGEKEGVQAGNITAIHARGSAIWIGGEFGLQQYDEGRFHAIQGLDPEALRGISGIVETADGDLWLNGLGGIVHIGRAEIARAIKDPLYRVSSERFDRRAGLPGSPSQVRRMPTAIEGSDGRLWFSVSGGVVWLDPKHRSARLPAPPVSIQSVLADNERYELDQPVRLPAGTLNVQIGYAAVSLLHPDSIRFRYRLQGLDDDWRDAGTLTSVSYRSLPPGDYRFEVDASDANGLWSKQPATAGFTILPAYYQTNWFRALCAMLPLLLAWAGYQLRVRQLHRQFEMTLDARVAERTRIARDLHDTLLQSFHGLLLRFQTALDLLPDRPAESRQVLVSAIDQAAEAVTEGRDAVQGLRTSATEINDLADSIRALGEELANENSSENVLRIEVQGSPRGLHPIVRDEVFRIAGEALRNAFRHAAARQIEVELRYDARQFRVRVRDDGKGINPEVLRAEGREGHFGLRGMRERAKVAGGKLTVWSGLDAGTEVELSIPAPHAYSSAPRTWLSKKVLGPSHTSDP
ncbi:MAG TPA: triple tyrosine motif-containing protein [Burkholderiaceae bacterium]|nr:triple tyrosine motif-containing protein [Burkholderiaceae bacterium]